MNILNVEKVSKTYGEKQLFDEVTLGVNKGDKIGVIGVNGTGKSTFLKIIAGLEEADAGQVVKGKGVTVAYLEQKAQFPEKDTILGYVLRGKHFRVINIIPLLTRDPPVKPVTLSTALSSRMIFIKSCSLPRIAWKEMLWSA